jgi:hypothetical protein
MIVGMVASGHAFGEILAAYPYLEEEDIRQALAYAAWRVEEIETPLSAEQVGYGSEVVAVCDAMQSQPDRAIPAEQVFATIRARHADRLKKRKPQG